MRRIRSQIDEFAENAITPVGKATEDVVYFLCGALYNQMEVRSDQGRLDRE
jgi:hypothetical protein